jgi:hypothetical protein
MSDKTPPSEDAPEPTPYIVTLVMPFGIVREFTVTEFDVDYDQYGRIASAKWAQASLMPGEDVLQFVSWEDVQLISTRSIEGP